MTLRLAGACEPGDLFATPSNGTPRVLVDDAQGGIRYWPDVVDAGTAQAWFETLRDGAAWETMRRPMYDRVVDVPRLLAAYPVEAFPEALPLRAMLERVRELAPAPYTSAGLNLYRDGNDSVAMHGDKLHALSEGHPITLVSLGAPRRMLVRAKAERRETLAIDLMPGSVLRMSHAAQSTHEHGIPKTRRAVGPRMSVVFRVRPAGASPYGGMRPRDGVSAPARDGRR
jgi:alkylated DNA repair dioxygenase AlkB